MPLSRPSSASLAAFGPWKMTLWSAPISRSPFTTTVLPAIESRPGPSPYLQGLVVDGKLGLKSGEGFRKWSAEEQAALRAKVVAHLKAMRDT